MRKRSVNFFFFSFFFQTLRFFQKIGQSFLCFSDFPKFTKPAKTFKNTSNFQNFNFLVWTSRPQLNQHNLYIYTFIHNKIFNIYNTQNYIYNEITVVVSSMAQLTTQEGTLPAHLYRVLKMFLKHTEKNELMEPSECTFSLK